MDWLLKFTPEAAHQLQDLENDPSQQVQLKAVRKCLGLMQTNLKHPSLQTHKYNSLSGPAGQSVFESYAQDRTPGAYRIFWYYGTNRGEIIIVSVVPHP